MLEVSVLYQRLALFCVFATIIIKFGCRIAVEMFCRSYQFSERNLFVQKSFENIRERLVQYYYWFLSVFKLNNSISLWRRIVHILSQDNGA